MLKLLTLELGPCQQRKRKKLTKKTTQTNKSKQKFIDIELLLQKSHKRERMNAELDATSNIKTNSK